MISDQGLAMFRDGLFVHSDDPKLCKVQKRNSKNVPLSTVIVNIKGQGPKEVFFFSSSSHNVGHYIWDWILDCSADRGYA